MYVSRDVDLNEVAKILGVDPEELRLVLNYSDDSGGKQ